MSNDERLGWIDPETDLSVVRQCELVGVVRATFYGRQRERTEKEEDLLLCRLIDEEYTRRPFYGSRRMVVFLAREGHVVNRKRVQRLMRQMGLSGMAPGPATSTKHPKHPIYPYLLRGMEIERPNQVWSSDISYIRLARGFAYLVVVMDWYSRKVLSWRISNSMDVTFCVDCLGEALSLYGRPEIFNSDQGSQYTSEAFTGILKREGIAISMDGRGRALDNIFVERLWRSVKYEDVYLKGYGSMPELTMGLADYFAYYNGERPHQSLANRTPDTVYVEGKHGGASIPDLFGGAREASPAPLRFAGDASRAETAQRSRAAIDEITTA
jgi:putative transposase